MSLLSESQWWLKRASNPAIRRVEGLRGRSTSNASWLKCDRVPQTPALKPGVPAYIDTGLAGKRHLIAMRCTGMTDASPPLISMPGASPGRCCGRSRQGALATLMAGSGDPYCSLVNLASHPARLADPADLASGGAYPEYSGRPSGVADARQSAPGATRWKARGSCWRAGPRRPAVKPWRCCAGATSTPIPPRRPLSILAIFRSSGSSLPQHIWLAGFGRILDLKPKSFLTDISDAGRAAGGRAGRHRTHE